MPEQGGTRVVRVSVTAEDIREGRARDCEACPLALAVGRAIGQPASVGLGTWEGRVDDIGGELPLRAKDFVWDFDHGDPLSTKPFSFEIEVPQ